MRRLLAGLLSIVIVAGPAWLHAAQPVRAKSGMVASQNFLASQIGVEVLWDGGTAVDAAVATAFALAVTHPTAGNIGGGGFLLHRKAGAKGGVTTAYDFRETAPAGASPSMFLKDGRYDETLHHESHLSVGVPGTVAGLYLAWKEHGKLPWSRLVGPAVGLAREGFVITDGLARSLKRVLPDMKRYPASVKQFSRDGVPYEMGDILKQPDLAKTLERIAASGPAGFYEGETARLIETEMKRGGGLITRQDLKDYRAKERTPLRGTYRGYDILTMPPPSSGGAALLTMLNMLEGDDLQAMGHGSAAFVHLAAEAMRRAFSERARHLGDPDHNPTLPLVSLLSKERALGLRKGIDPARASVSSPDSFAWPGESGQTTHISVVDLERSAVSLTYTLEDEYGSKIVVPGAGFLLNNEMGDFNAGPGLTTKEGLVGTTPNLAAPGKRMLSSMTPTIVTRDGKLFLVLGSPGGRTIINTVLLTLVNMIDFGMNVQEAVDAPRFHHQWLPDRISHEKRALSPDTLALLRQRGHTLYQRGTAPDDSEHQGVVQAIRFDPVADLLEGASDRRVPDGAAIGR
jgi:gamma-glutamyltranspeptidase / glutathione hydrolase